MSAYQTRIVTVDPQKPDPKAVEEAAGFLRAGELVVIPTDTVYGLTALGSNDGSVRRIFEVKGRAFHQPLILLVADPEDIAELVDEVTPEARMLAEKFWPGPLTMILRRSAMVSDAITAGGDSVGVRCPDSEVARALIRASGGPLATTSANLSGGPPSVTAGEVLEQLGGEVPLVLDGGTSPIGVSSTVIDLSSTPARILRTGTITREQLMMVLEL